MKIYTNLVVRMQSFQQNKEVALLEPGVPNPWDCKYWNISGEIKLLREPVISAINLLVQNEITINELLSGRAICQQSGSLDSILREFNIVYERYNNNEINKDCNINLLTRYYVLSPKFNYLRLLVYFG